MGYTHYYRTKATYPKKLFSNISKDFLKMLEPLDHLGVKLGNGWGEKYPIITESKIEFNGIAKCGHTERSLGITWPAKNAKGVTENKVGQQLQEITKGNWFAGASLETRTCGGDCSHEALTLDQTKDKEDLKRSTDIHGKSELQFQFTKTAYKPYDLAVNVCLIIAKHYLKENIKISSDGEIENWREGMQLCEHFLGYGENFKLDIDE